MNKIYIVETNKKELYTPSGLERICLIAFKDYDEALKEVHHQVDTMRKKFKNIKLVHEGAAVGDTFLKYRYRYYMSFINEFNEIIRYGFTITECELI